MATIAIIRLMTATVSPPPATETNPCALVRSAAKRAIVTVPWSNGGISNAPSGPFQTSVAASSSTPLIRSIDCGPTSRIIPSPGIASRP